MVKFKLEQNRYSLWYSLAQLRVKIVFLRKISFALKHTFLQYVGLLKLFPLAGKRNSRKATRKMKL